MLKRTIIALGLAAGMLQAQNLIKDPDFDKGMGECFLDVRPGTVKVSVATEDRTWNKCLSFENVKYSVDKNGKRTTNVICRIGRDKGNIGFKVEPDTTYEFQFEFKGKIIPRVQYTEWNGPDLWKNMKTRTAKLELKPVASTEWTVVKGSFTTAHDAKRAALTLQIFGGDVWGTLPPLGPAFMIDKVRVEKKVMRVPGSVPAAEKITVPCILPGKTYSGFVLMKDHKPAPAQTFCSCTMKDGRMIVDVRCMEPSMAKIVSKTAKDGGNVWQDDCVEIFFNSGDPKRILNQFVVTAGGIRWMGHGNSDVVNEYDKWTASVKKEADAWTVHAEIPLSLLGWNKDPEAGEMIRFFVARTRTAGQEVSSLAPVNGGFHNKRCWGYFFPYGLNPWFVAVKKNLLKQAAISSELTEKIGKWTSSGIPEQDLAMTEAFRKSIMDAKYAGLVITCNPVTNNPEIPYFPVTLAHPAEKITVRSAGNDIMFVSLAVTNTTSAMEEYRIVVSSLDKDGDEIHLLKTADGKVYPADKMTLFRGVRVKNANHKSRGLCFDPLAPLDVTKTVTVGPGESLPVWIKFNTRDVTPGVYSGVVRVIPLSQPSTRKAPAYRDVPFSFEVLPFALTQDFPTYHNLFQIAPNKDCFRLMLESRINGFLLGPYRAHYTFDEKGNITGRNSKVLEQNIREYQAWAKELGYEGQIHYCFCYNVYTHFRDIVTGKKFKPFSPEWETAWLAYMKEIDAVRQKYNIPADHWSIELADEPKKELLPELIRASELAVKANPDLRFLISFVWDMPGRWDMPEELYMQLVPYVHEWCFHTMKGFSIPKYKGLLEALRSQKKLISLYTCSTSMREDLQTYYRRHAWTVPCFDLQGCHMYQHTNYKFKYHDWKEPAEGEVALLSGPDAVTTIRGECLNAGFSDLRYYLELKKLYEGMDKNTPLGREIGEFLTKTPKKLVLETPESAAVFDEAREKMIDLILKALLKKNP